MAKSLFSLMLNQYFRLFLLMVMKCHHFSDRHQTAKLLLFPQSLSANCHSTEKTACLENLIWTNTVMLELRQKNDRKGISCFSKPTSLSRWVPPLPAGFPFPFILCFLRAHLTDGLPALVCNYPTSTRATSFQKLNDLIGESSLMNKWECFVICTSRLAYSDSWRVWQQLQSGTFILYTLSWSPLISFWMTISILSLTLEN